MTHINDRAEQPTAEDKVSENGEPTAAEMLQWRRDTVLLPETRATVEEFPSLRNISDGFMFDDVVRPGRTRSA